MDSGATEVSETVSPKVSTTNPGNDVPADGNGKDAPNAPAPAPLPPSNAPLRTRLDEILPGPKDLPADPLTGIYPLFLTSMTQDLFKIKTGEDVTAERPMKVIPKADILADMYTRAAISDWSPLKQLVNEYPKDEILLHYDADFKYSQNFFVCLSEEATEAIIRIYMPIIESIPEDGAGDGLGASKAARVRGWISQGTEKEMEMETVVPMREKIMVKFSKKRKEFTLPCKFGDRDAHEAFLECRPYRDTNVEVTRSEAQIGIQAIPTTLTSASQTSWFRPLNFGCQYEPAEMQDSDKENHLSSKAVEGFCQNVLVRFEHALQQNEISDIFYNDLGRLGEDEFSAGNNSQIVLQEYQSFTDLIHSKDKSISCIDWHPSQKGVLAVSCVSPSTLDERVGSSFKANAEKAVILIWSFQDPIHPQLILEAPDEVHSFQINPEEQNIVVAGCANGQVALWDISEFQDKLKTTRKAGTDRQEDGSVFTEKDKHVGTPRLPYVLCSSIEASHRGVITDLKWLPKHSELGHNGDIVEMPENGHKQFYTCSLDGTVAFWDLRFKKDLASLDLTWRPFLRFSLSAMDNTFDYGLNKISIIPPVAAGKGVAMIPSQSSTGSDKSSTVDKGNRHSQSKFYCATEEGDLIYADWINEKTGEDKGSRVETSMTVDYGPMSDLQRSPFFSDVVLSVGGWSFSVWKEKLTIGPLLSSGSTTAYVTCGKWSPSRPGVFYITRSDGTLEVWDLLDKTFAPSSVQNIAGSAVSQLAIHQYPSKSSSGPQFIAAGDDEGVLHILEVPKTLSRPARNEKNIVTALIEREVKRIHYVNERKKLRSQSKGAHDAAIQEANMLAAAKAKAESSTSEGESKKEDSQSKEEQSYKAMEKEFLSNAGLLVEATE